MVCTDTGCVCIPNDETRAEGFLFMGISFIPSLLLVYVMFRFCIKPIALSWSNQLEAEYNNAELMYSYDKKQLREMKGFMLKIRLILKGYTLCSMFSLIYVSSTETRNYNKCLFIEGYFIHDSYFNLILYGLLFTVFIFLWIDATLHSMINYTQYSRSIGMKQKQYFASMPCCYYLCCCCLWDKAAAVCGFCIKYISFVFDIMGSLAIGASWTIYNPLGDIYSYSHVSESGVYQNLVVLENDCLCPLSATNFVILYLTVGLVLCIMTAFILNGPCRFMQRCCNPKGACRDTMELLVHLAEYGGTYLFAGFLFVVRCDELAKRWDAFEENSHWYITHITFSDVFFILFCIATLIWIVFNVRKWCKRTYGELRMSSIISNSMRELSALTANDNDDDNDDVNEQIGVADL